MRLSSERDSRCFTNDKIASSRTMLINGHKAPVSNRSPHPGCSSNVVDSAANSKLLYDRTPLRGARC